MNGDPGKLGFLSPFIRQIPYESVKPFIRQLPYEWGSWKIGILESIHKANPSVASVARGFTPPMFWFSSSAVYGVEVCVKFKVK